LTTLPPPLRRVILVVAQVSSILAQPYIWAAAVLVDELNADHVIETD
jgi:hypothetical protein